MEILILLLVCLLYFGIEIEGLKEIHEQLQLYPWWWRRSDVGKIG